MDLGELVHSIMIGDLLTARQWVADARRASFQWEKVARPTTLTSLELRVAAGLVELLASRSGHRPPGWTAEVGAEPEVVVLDPGLEQMPRSYARARTEGPEPLRKRNLIALPDFLEVA